MLEAGFVLPTLLSINERDFFDTARSNKSRAINGDNLLNAGVQIPNAKSIVITTGTGKELVCFKLEK